MLSDCGYFIAVLSPALLGSADEYKRRVFGYADSMCATRAIDPAQPVRVPFDRSIADRARRKADSFLDVADPIYDARRCIVAPATNS
jgi:LDH2 family malate/lactate/ureidoglycolate dehydrogenase